MDKQTFSLAQILTMTTGRLLCPIGEVYEISNFLTQDNLFTHQLPRAGRVIEPYLKEILPQFDGGEFTFALGQLISGLESDVVKGHEKEFISGWLFKQAQQYGATFELEPMPPERWLSIDPFEELQEDLTLAGKDPNDVMVVQI